MMDRRQVRLPTTPSAVLDVYSKCGDKFKKDKVNLSLTDACKHSRVLNDYNRKHRVVQKLGNVVVLTTLDTNKTKESIGL